MKPYHSALHPPLKTESHTLIACDGPNGSLVFQCDWLTGLPPDYANCDVIYSDPPWKAGYDTFNERAGKKFTVPYDEFLARLNRTIRIMKKPTVMVVGMHMLEFLHPDHFTETTLNGAKAYAGFWYMDPIYSASSRELLTLLAAQYETVGDYMCGYGRAGEFFLQAGKRCILSDFNPNCIAVVAEMFGRYGG